MHRFLSLRKLMSAFLVSGFLLAGAQPGESQELRWWKGNLHTHTYWSDGNDFPEMVVDWYHQNGYHFLTLTDHNVLSQGERWVDLDKIPNGEEALPEYRARFGDEWVETREVEGVLQVRLKPLDEFRRLFESPDQFMMMQGEEITGNYTYRKPVRAVPVHLNATNLIELIMPRTGNSVTETLQKNIDAVLEQREKTGRIMFPHINHPNFGWAITAEDMIPLEGEQFFEVYNGHPSVRNFGDERHAGMERVWDIINTKRLAEEGKEVMYGLATDDAHSYHTRGSNQSNPGRGWVMVRAKFLTPESIITALEAGDFYSSSGVVLEDIAVTEDGLSIHIQPEDGVTYTTRFMGTRQHYDPSSEAIHDAEANELPVTRRYSSDIGAVLAEAEGLNPSYQFTGDEIYVRATVVSSKRKENPYAEGEYEQAWVQPVVLNP